MHRRQFLRLLGLSATSSFCINSNSMSNPSVDDFSLNSKIKTKLFVPDLELGHRLRDPKQIIQGWLKSDELPPAETLIAGAGVAGLSCAYHLNKASKEFIIIDPLDRAGGTSASIQCGALDVPLGAHYLMSPPAESNELRQFLFDVKAIISKSKGINQFDKNLLLNTRRSTERSFYNGQWYEGIGDSLGNRKQSPKLKKFHHFWQFLSDLKGDDGRRWFSIPTGKSSRDLKALELFKINFVDYLRNAEMWDEQVEYVVNYACMDDYGCLANQVSAWVGFHYFACRPYYEIPVTLTSSSGNAWLVKALLKNISSSKTQWNTVLASFKEHSQGIDCLLTNRQGKWWRQTFHNVVYAGKNHTLKYLNRDEWFVNGLKKVIPNLPRDQKIWLTTQIRLNSLPNSIEKSLCWDNVDIHSSSVGYIHANHQQSSTDNNTVITHFFPISAKLNWSSEELQSKSKDELLELVISDLKNSSPELLPYISEVVFRPMFHAMAIPDVKQTLPSLKQSTLPYRIKNIFLCNSDTYGLPLFEEAFQIGFHTSDAILKKI